MRNLYEIKSYLQETTENILQAFKRLEKRKVRLVPWLAGVVFLLLFIGVLTQVKENYREENVELTQQAKETKQTIKSLEEQQKALQLKYEELRKLQEDHKHELETKIKEIKAKKAQIKLLSQPPRSQPVQPLRSSVGNCEAYRPLVSQYSWNVEVALAVMKAESGCNPNAANWNDNHKVCKGSFGLYQIACFDGQVFDPSQNVAIAYRKYQARGWQPWTVCTKGVVNCY